MNRTTRTPYYESENPGTVARGIGWRIGVIFLAAIAASVVIGGIFLGINTLTASPRGRAEAYQQKETANNRIFAQQTFEKQYADLQATKVKITAAAQARTTSPEAEVRYQGLISYCASVAADYNAAARSYTTQDFRAADLPAQIDPTECEPTK